MNNRLYNSIAQNFDLNYVFFLGHRKRARYRHRSEHSLCHLWDCVNAESCVTTHGKMLHEGNILFKLMLSPGKLGNIVVETFVILDVSSNVSPPVETLLRKQNLLPEKQKCFPANSETFDVSLCFSLMFPSVCPLLETWRNISRKQCFLVCPGLSLYRLNITDLISFFPTLL
jgi:hypothetical protein